MFHISFTFPITAPEIPFGAVFLCRVSALRPRLSA